MSGELCGLRSHCATASSGARLLSALSPRRARGAGARRARARGSLNLILKPLSSCCCCPDCCLVQLRALALPLGPTLL